jgi:2-polyprenyl-3-methyl-5-hydroxy-6-metoxy-1,4-benzoquinol methylase
MQDKTLDRYRNSSKSWWIYDPKYSVLSKIIDPESVLDVGCSYGDFGRALKGKNCTVDGVEIYEPAVKEAKLILDEVFQLDMDRPELVGAVINKKYSVITFMDVLEHSKDPAAVLRAYREKLSEGGRIYVSVPNIVNIRDRFSILFGNFNYKEYGVMDKTHLRFFTKKTANELMLTVFSNVELIDCTPRYNFLKKIVRFWPEMFALQFVFEGKL